MSWNGIFYNGVWSCGFDFLPDGAIATGGVFDISNPGGGGVGSAYARFGTGKGVQISGNAVYLGRTFNASNILTTAGFGFSTTALAGSPNVRMICTFYDTTAGAQQVSLGYDTNGKLGCYTTGGFPSYGAATLIAGTQTASSVIVPNSYYLIEILAWIAVSGALQVHVNGNSVINFTGNTKTTANAYSNRLYLGANQSDGGGAVHQFDDLYILDMTGTGPLSTFLGNGRVQTDGPNADSATGGLNQWAFTTPQGSDFANAANIPANAAQFNSSSTVGNRMSFRFPAFLTKPTFLNTWYSANIDTAGTRAIEPIFRSNNVDQVAPVPNTLGSSFTYYNQPSTIDPNTNDLWFNGTTAAASACEIGLEVST